MPYNTFGLIPVALIRQITSNSPRLLTLCIAGTVTQLNAMSIYWMSLAPLLALIISLIHSYRIWIFGKANSLLRVGHSKSFLPLI